MWITVIQWQHTWHLYYSDNLIISQYCFLCLCNVKPHDDLVLRVVVLRIMGDQDLWTRTFKTNARQIKCNYSFVDLFNSIVIYCWCLVTWWLIPNWCVIFILQRKVNTWLVHFKPPNRNFMQLTLQTYFHTWISLLHFFSHPFQQI